MDYVKVELQDVIINGYGKGSVIEMLKPTAHRLIKQGYVTEVKDETPIKITITADNGKVPVINMNGKTVKITS
ncbi:hypothetical protein ACQCVB_17735 [Fictibacillus phosphorivorans]|uniref:hypothetical protein n=1 Tax=Fictibacillus phosphorivorans TaxID=1221500 RepID=UPI003CEFE33E